MAKAKVCFIFLILLGITLPAGAECWRWVKTEPSADIDLQDAGFMLAFDEGRGRPVLFLVRHPYGGPFSQELWHYDGAWWSRTWEGEIIPPGTPTLDNYVGLYFDRVRSALVLIGTDTWAFEQSSVYAYEYREGAGWSLVAEYSVASWGGGSSKTRTESGPSSMGCFFRTAADGPNLMEISSTPLKMKSSIES